MIIHTPFPTDRNLGRAYNQIMESTAEEFVIFKDADVCFLTPTQPLLIPQYIEQYPDAGMFTCFCNRVGYSHQRLGGIMSEDTDFTAHQQAAAYMENDPVKATKLGPLVSGFFMVISRKAWQDVGPFKDGLLSVDDDFSRRVHKRYPIYRMDNLYLWHTYRLGKSWKDTSHLK